MSLEARYAALEIDAVERDQAPGDLTPFSSHAQAAVIRDVLLERDASAA